MEETSFSELGLNKYEGMTYEALVKFGKLSAAEVSKYSGVPYSRIYDVLSSLVSKTLVEIVPEKTKKFVPSSPENLLKLIEKKEELLVSAKEKVKELRVSYEQKEKQPVVMGEGRAAFYKIVRELKEPKKFEYVIKWFSEYRPDWERLAKERMKRGVDMKTLVRYDDETKNNIIKWKKVDKEMRKFENEGVAMSIGDDEIMISLIKSSVTLLIRDKPFIKIMKKMFIDSFGNAEPIK